MFPLVLGALGSVAITMSPQFVESVKPVMVGKSVGLLPKTMLSARGVAGVSHPSIGAFVEMGTGAEVGEALCDGDALMSDAGLTC